MRKLARGFGNLAVTIVAAVILIFLGILFFMITVWTIKIGSSWAGLKAIDSSMIVLTAGIISAAAIIGSAIQQ